MQRRVLTILLLIFSKAAYNQTCTNAGQTPASAIFICGSGVHIQNSVPTCGNLQIPAPCTDGYAYSNRNPVWFRFACFNSGQLGFTITPDDASENFDWQLFDKTGRNPEDVFSDPTLLLACNWSGDIGETGASSNGSLLLVCSGATQPLFSSMPTLIQGHEYLLMISHFNSTTNGFILEFTNGVNNIIDPVQPYLKSVRTSCDGSKVIVKLNTKIKCNTLAADGSDFNIMPSPGIASAIAFSCASKPDTDSVVLSLNSPLSVGNYTVSVKNGSDGNTLMDHCGRFIANGNSIPLVVIPLQATPLDSITKPTCKPNKLELFFQRPIQCNSIAPNGSDFLITGPQNIGITGARYDCGSSLSTQVIILDLTTQITRGGFYTLQLVNGTDGNTLLDECGLQTPPSSKIFFITDNVDATFTYSMKAGCKKDTIQFLHNGSGAATNWSWKFDNNITSSQQNPVQVFPATGNYKIQLIVSNGTCSDTAKQDLVLNNEVTVSFETPDIICPEDGLQLKNNTRGTVDQWTWSYGDGNGSIIKDPPNYFFKPSSKENIYTISLTVSNNAGCTASLNKQVRVLSSCYIAVPTAFSPNNDGINDFLYPLNAVKAENLDFRIYNRYGQLVFASKDWQKKWDGNSRGLPMPSGIYIWTLRYTHRDTRQKHEMKGMALLIR